MNQDRRESRRASVASQSFFKLGDVNDKYIIGEVLGVGNYAEVKLGINKVTKEKVAIKVLPLQKETTQDILNEIDILARVDDHPHVIQLKEIYENNGIMYIVTELVTGGELFDRIIKRQKFNEADARDLIHVLIETIRHMHSYGIVHRDIKPENILFASPAPDAPIKLADFGLAKLYQPAGDDQLKTLCGTPGYVAPEVLKNRNGYTPQCDMWSIGVILYILLCGYPPFQHEQQNKLFKQILKADYHFHSPYWDKVSKEAKDLISKLLVVNPDKRLTPAGAMSHPFMKMTTPGASVDVETLSLYVRKIHKRKFRLLTNALTAARSIASLAQVPETSKTSENVTPLNLMRNGSSPQPGFVSPLAPKSFRNNSADDDDANLTESARFRKFDAEWVKARQISIVRKSSRATELKRKTNDIPEELVVLES